MGTSSLSLNNIKVIVCDTQDHLQYLGVDQAIKHCTKGLGIWEWASNDQGVEAVSLEITLVATCGQA